MAAQGRASGTAGELRAFRRLVDAIGLEGALLLRAWAGGQAIYPPRRFDDKHILCRLLGEEAFRRLIDAYGQTGDLTHVPACELTAVRRAGIVHRLTAARLGALAISQFCGTTDRQVQRIQKHLRGSGRLFGLDEDASDDAPAEPVRQQAATPAPPPPGDVLAQLRAARLNHAARDRDYAD